MESHLAIGGPIDGDNLFPISSTYFVEEIRGNVIDGPLVFDKTATIQKHRYLSHWIKGAQKDFYFLVHESLSFDEALQRVFDFYFAQRDLYQRGRE